MQGRPAIIRPVWINVMAGSWLIASVCMERTIAMSSAIFPMFGRTGTNDHTRGSGPPARPLAFDLSLIGGTGDLDEGLNGERGAIPAAIGWLMAALATWLVAGRLARDQLGWKRRHTVRTGRQPGAAVVGQRPLERVHLP